MLKMRFYEREVGAVFSAVLRLIVLAVLLAGAGLYPRAATAKVLDIIETDNMDFDFSTRSGLRLRFVDPPISLRVGGRVHADAVFVKPDLTRIQGSDVGLRRARLYLTGRLDKRFRFKIDREFAPDRRGWRNLYLGFRIRDGLSIKGGNIVAPFGMEEIITSNNSTFMERSVSSVLAPSFQTGILLKANGHFADRASRHRWTLSGAWLTEPLGKSRDDRRRSNHDSFVGRVTYAPIARRGRVIHVGFALVYSDLKNQSLYRVRTRPESSLVPTFLNTGRLADVKSATTLGIETAAVFGPVTFQAEYMQTFLQRSQNRPDPNFKGGYAQLSYVLTGETRRYKRATAGIAGLRPRHKWGAVEVAVRFSSLDLNSETVNGGRTRNWTIGVNWYVLRNLRVTANYTAVNARLRRNGGTDRPHIGQIRLQVFF